MASLWRTLLASFRTERTRKKVIRIYQSLLGRSADPEGLQFYMEKILAGDITPAGLRSILKNSPEYSVRIAGPKPDTRPDTLKNKNMRRINLGCGYDRRDGYINVDNKSEHYPDLIADVGNLGMLPNDMFDEALAQDILEHLPRTKTSHVLKEWNRILKPGGRLILRVPSVTGLADLLKNTENASFDNQKIMIQNLFGTQAYPGDFHFTGFTEILLKHYLIDAGFAEPEIQLVEGWLFDVVAVKL